MTQPPRPERHRAPPTCVTNCDGSPSAGPCGRRQMWITAGVPAARRVKVNRDHYSTSACALECGSTWSSGGERPAGFVQPGDASAVDASR